MPCGLEALKAAGCQRIFSEKAYPFDTYQPMVLRPKRH
jgi:hypothetical protein